MAEIECSSAKRASVSRNRFNTPSILEEDTNIRRFKRSSIEKQLEWRNPCLWQVYSTATSASSSLAASPTGSNQTSRKNSENTVEAKSSTTKTQSQYSFYSMNLVEHRIIRPGKDSTLFPWS